MADGKRTAVTQTLWLLQADRDGMHPLVMGYVHEDPEARNAAPGAWDAASDDMLSGGSPDSPRIARIAGGPEAARRLAAFVRSASRLPDPSCALGLRAGPGILPASAGPGLGMAHAVRLVRAVAALPTGDNVDRLFAHAADALLAEASDWVGQLARNRRIAMDPSLPGVRRYLDRHEPHRERLPQP